MSFQAYLDTIKRLTGKTPEDFKKLAAKKGFLHPEIKAGAIIAWLKEDFSLGHGHAMAIYTVFKGTSEKKIPLEDVIAKHFTGTKAEWKPVFDNLCVKVKKKCGDFTISPVASYLSFLKNEKKFAIVQVTTQRMDIGIKRKGEAISSRFEAAGSWNAMMTHRVKITEARQVDAELLTWLDEAYKAID
ncbi:MAG: DUF4287 domain-containing protein [Bacteroidota bacterium]